jgi:hypothetical protein
MTTHAFRVVIEPTRMSARSAVLHLLREVRRTCGLTRRAMKNTWEVVG